MFLSFGRRKKTGTVFLKTTVFLEHSLFKTEEILLGKKRKPTNGKIVKVFVFVVAKAQKFYR